MSLGVIQSIPDSVQEEAMTETVFLENLYLFMRNRGTPIERIPYLGFKQIDLFLLYKTVQSLGGFNQVTANQKWKQVYNMLGSDPRSTSAATCTRRHYQKLLLPFECHLKGQEVALTPPLPEKRSRQNHLPDEDYVREVKRRAMEKQMNLTFFQRPHDYLTDTCIRSTAIPTVVQRYPYPRFPPQPLYHPVLPSMLPYTQFQQLHRDPEPRLQTHPHQRATFEPDSAEAWEAPKQELLTLRKLAVEYLSSAGWEEPLDLTHRDGSLDSISQRPSSFSLAKGSGAPKFLNKVSSMYSSWNLSQDESCEESGNKVTNKEANMKNSPRSQEQTDTQSVAESFPTATLPLIPSRKSCSPSAQFNLTSSAYVVPPTALPRNSSRSDEEEEEVPLSLKHSLSVSTASVEGQRLIQIPLKLLEACIKSRLDTQNLCFREKTVQLISGPHAVENYEHIRKVKMEFPVKKDVSELGYGKFETERHL